MTTDTTGNTDWNAPISGVRGGPVTASANGTLTTLGVYVKSGGSSSYHVRLKLYTDSSNNPNSLIAETDSTGTPSSGWLDIQPNGNYSRPSIVSGTQYWIAVESDTTNPVFYYRASHSAYVAHIYGNGPNPFGTSTDTNADLYMRMTYSPPVLRTFSESVAVADLFSRTLNIARTDSEPSIAATETWTRTRTVPRTLSEPAISVADAIARSAITFSRTLSEPGITVSDLFTDGFVISGVTRDASGNPLGSCTVQIFKSSDATFIASTTSDGSGNFSFTVTPSNFPCFMRAYLAGAPDVFGTTDQNVRT